MGDESDDASETGSQNVENIGSSLNTKVEGSFDCCSRKCSVYVCVFCEKVFHKSCMKRMENVKRIDSFHVNCCQSQEIVERLPRRSDGEILSNHPENFDRKLLETKIHFLTQLLDSANEKNEILKLNNSLLMEKVKSLEHTSNPPKKKVNKQREFIDNRPQFATTEIPLMKIDTIDQETVTNDPTD